MKKFVIIIAVILVLFLFLFGWVHGDGGNFAVHQENVSKIIKGLTSAAEIINIFGEPAKADDLPQGTKWTYSRFSADFNFIFRFEMRRTIKELELFFDSQGIVKDFKFREIKYGIFKNKTIQDLVLLKDAL